MARPLLAALCRCGWAPQMLKGRVFLCSQGPELFPCRLLLWRSSFKFRRLKLAAALCQEKIEFYQQPLSFINGSVRLRLILLAPGLVELPYILACYFSTRETSRCLPHAPSSIFRLPGSVHPPGLLFMTTAPIHSILRWKRHPGGRVTLQICAMVN